MKIRAKAPLRLGFAGGGSDVSPYSDEYGGYILNSTISLYAYCTIETTNDNLIRIESSDLDIYQEFSSNSKYFKLDGNLDLIKQIFNHLIQNNYLESFPPFFLKTHCDAPPGSGLGTSSTMVVAVLKAITEWLYLPFGEHDLAKIAYRIERVDLNLSGGKQDQYAAAFGGFNFMEFYSNNTVVVNPLRIKKWIINELNSSMLIFNLGSSRSSAAIIDEQRKSMKKNRLSLSAMHNIKKDALRMKEQLIKGNIDKISLILSNSWANKKLLSNKVSSPEIDNIFEIAKINGALSGKISGAGGGGTLMLIIDPSKKISVVNALENIGCKHIEFIFTEGGCHGWKIK